MKSRTLALLLVAGAVTAVAAADAWGMGPAGRARWRNVAESRSWNANYVDPQWGQPHALVIPPNAETHVNYSWGVTGTERAINYHQFHRRLPGGYGGGVGVYPAPVQPYHTDQMGTYYVRAPAW